jgi:pimeloyl-ACP methyl ester carboxylesterase
VSWVQITGRDVHLEALDFGGTGTGALLLHGLAGTAREWEETAAWLAETHRVVALDQRGHGRSERRPADVTREAFVADAVAAIEQLGLARVVLIGQSLGAHTAFLVAAKRPDRVRALVVAEASPAKADPAAFRQVAELLSGWPVPFPTREAAVEFFGGDSLRARAWANNLEECDGGLTRAFDVDIVTAALVAAADSYWDEWATISAPCLVVRGETGELSAADAELMGQAQPFVEVVAIPGGHDVHLDAPEDWQDAVSSFRARLR